MKKLLSLLTALPLVAILMFSPLVFADTGDIVVEGKPVTGKIEVGGGTLELPNSDTLPGTCAVGDTYVLTDALSGSQYYVCESINVWTPQGSFYGAAYFPDYNEADQGATGDAKSAKAHIDIIAANNATLIFRHNSGAATTTYTFSTSETIPSNINIVIEKGAILTVANLKILTINGPFEAGLYQVFSGDGRVVYGVNSINKIPVIWRGVLSDGTNTTTEMQALLLDIKGSDVKRCEFDFGVYLFIDTLNVYAGMVLEGQCRFPVTGLQGSLTLAEIPTQINFAPTSEKSLFHVINDTADMYSTKVHISGLYLKGNTTGGVTHSQYGIHLEESAQSTLKNMGIERFQVGLYCDFTMTNKYNNLYIGKCSSACVDTSTDLNTSDIFTNCIFRESPWGVILRRGPLFRFSNCLFETLSVGGARIYKEAGADFVSCYSENTPSGVGGTDYGMFYISHDGTASSYTINIIGGQYVGCNGATKYGSFIDANYVLYFAGINVTSVKVYGYINGIKANVTNSNGNSIRVNNIEFEGVTNLIVNGWDNTVGSKKPIIIGNFPLQDSETYSKNVISRMHSTHYYLEDIRNEGKALIQGMGNQLADNASYLIANVGINSAMMVFVVMSNDAGVNESGMFCVTTDGAGNTTVAKVVGTANTAITEVDAKLCVLPITTSVYIKNKLNATVNCRVFYVR